MKINTGSLIIAWFSALFLLWLVVAFKNSSANAAPEETRNLSEQTIGNLDLLGFHHTAQ